MRAAEKELGLSKFITTIFLRFFRVFLLSIYVGIVGGVERKYSACPVLSYRIEQSLDTYKIYSGKKHPM